MANPKTCLRRRPARLRLPAPPKRPAADALKERLKETMHRDRRRLLRTLAIVVVVLTALVAGALWFMIPPRPLPPMLAVAFDSICLPGEETQVAMQIEPAEADRPMPASVAGLEVAFVDVQTPGPPLARTVTDKTGLALAAVRFAEAAPEIRFQGRLIGNRRVKGTIDQARMFHVPRNAPIVLIDVQELLADPAQDLSSSKDLNQIPAHEPTARRLQSLAKSKKQIVYFAVKSDRAQAYHQARRWLMIKGPMLPPGPVMGRRSFHDGMSAADAQRPVVRDLIAHWSVSALARRSEGADFYRSMGVPLEGE